MFPSENNILLKSYALWECGGFTRLIYFLEPTEWWTRWLLGHSTSGSW